MLSNTNGPLFSLMTDLKKYRIKERNPAVPRENRASPRGFPKVVKDILAIELLSSSACEINTEVAVESNSMKLERIRNL